MPTARPTTTSADSSRRVRAPSCDSSTRGPFRPEARPPRVRTLAVSTRLPDLRHSPLATGTSRSFARSSRSATPRIRFLSISPWIRYPTSSRRSVTLTPLWIASLAVAYSGEDSHLRVNAHAGHTNAKRAGISAIPTLKPACVELPRAPCLASSAGHVRSMSHLANRVSVMQH